MTNWHWVNTPKLKNAMIVSYKLSMLIHLEPENTSDLLSCLIYTEHYSKWLVVVCYVIWKLLVLIFLCPRITALEKCQLNPIFDNIALYPSLWMLLHYLAVNWMMVRQWQMDGIHLSLYITSMSTCLVKEDDTISPISWSRKYNYPLLPSPSNTSCTFHTFQLIPREFHPILNIFRAYYLGSPQLIL